MKLTAQKMGSVAHLKQTLKKGASAEGTIYIKNIPADGLTVRFLTEPEEWFGYQEYWEATERTFIPMVEGEILPDDTRPSFRYLAVALDVASDRVIPIKLPKTAANSLILKYDKYGTMTDRDYELEKFGTGLSTKYDVTPSSPMERNLAKYEILDLEKILINARALATGEEVQGSSSTTEVADEDIDTEGVVDPALPISSSSTDQYRDDDGTLKMDYPKDDLTNMPEDIRNEVLDEWGLVPEHYENVEDAVMAVLKAQAQFLKDNPEFHGTLEPQSTSLYDESALRGMPMAEVRKIATDLSLSTEGKRKSDIISDIIDASEV